CTTRTACGSWWPTARACAPRAWRTRAFRAFAPRCRPWSARGGRVPPGPHVRATASPSRCGCRAREPAWAPSGDPLPPPWIGPFSLEASLSPGLGFRPRVARAEHALDLRAQVLRQARLREKPVAARLLRTLGRAFQRVTGEREDENVPGPRILLDGAGRLPSIDAGQREIHDDEVRHQLRGLAEGLFAIDRLGHTQARELEVRRVHLAVVVVVVDDQHERRHTLAPCRRLRHTVEFRAAPGSAHRPRFACRGSTSEKVEPLPIWLCSVMRPSIMSARRRQIDRPSPAPLYCRVGELSACWKSSKTFSWSDGAMPMPVSITAMEISSLVARERATTLTEPSGVNLSALVRRLSTICFTF